jgi:hypothetical protein
VIRGLGVDHPRLALLFLQERLEPGRGRERSRDAGELRFGARGLGR